MCQSASSHVVCNQRLHLAMNNDNRRVNFGLTNTPLEKSRVIIRAKIIALREAGFSINQIKDQVGCSKSTVTNWIRRLAFLQFLILFHTVTLQYLDS